jgi:hypothetical protein
MNHTPSLKASDLQLRFGWWSLLAYLSLGIGLEILHGFKIGWYLDVGNETRRLMFTLAHAHGVLLALVNLAAGFTVRVVPGFELAPSASNSLLGAAVLLPGGFFLGGVAIHGGDPGLGIWIVPIGAILLLYGVGRVALDLSRFRLDNDPDPK